MLKSYIDKARKSRSDEAWLDALEYYSIVKLMDSENVEASIYTLYAEIMPSVGNNIDSLIEPFKILGDTMKTIHVSVDTNEKDNEKIFSGLCDDIIKLASYVTKIAVANSNTNMITNANNLCAACMEMVEEIALKYPDDEKEQKMFFYELALTLATWTLENGRLANPSSYQNIIMTYHKIINELDANHEVPKSAPTAPSNGGCYVATCVYGSYDCPQVWTLRRYRDDQLAKTWYGRVFIHTYYAVSPAIVKWFGETTWFKNMWKGKLDKMVSNLQAEGVESTPYEDKVWK